MKSKRGKRAAGPGRATTVVGASLDDAYLARLDEYAERLRALTGVSAKRGTVAAALIRQALDAEEGSIASG